MFKKLSVVVLLAITISIWACSDSKSTGGGSGGGCTTSSCSCDSLCTDANYASGEETDFGGGVVECVCSGSGDELEKNNCETYCDQFDVSPDNSFVSTDTNTNDKCVCDGTV